MPLSVYSFTCFSKRLPDPVLEVFVDEIDAKLIQGVGTAGHVLRSGNVKETDESGEVFFVEPLVDMFVQLGKEKGVKGFGQIISS